jgi:hypothetical protein
MAYIDRPWTDISAISNSYAARVTILIPLIGYMIIFNANIIRWLDLVKGLDTSQSPDSIPARLLFIYFGLCAIALGTVIYGIFCPQDARQYASADAYVGDAVTNVPMMVRKQYERILIGSSFKSELETLNRANYAPDEKWRAFLHIYFRYLNTTHTYARRVVALSYATGITLLAVPSTEVFIKIVGIMFGWTTRLI